MRFKKGKWGISQVWEGPSEKSKYQKLFLIHEQYLTGPLQYISNVKLTEPSIFFISWTFENDNNWILKIGYYINLGR